MPATAARQPLSPSACSRARRLSRRVASSCASIHSRSGSGSASRTRLLRQAAGRSHNSPSWLDGSPLSVGLSPRTSDA